MIKLVSILAGLVGVFWMAIAGWWWDAQRPAGWPSYAMQIGPFHHTFSLPDGYGTKYRALVAQNAAAAAHVVRVAKAQTAVTVAAERQEVAAQATIRTVYRTITLEVPAHVTPAIDRAWPLSVGFIRVLDAGATGMPDFPGPTGLADDSPSPDAPSVVATAVVDNDRVCTANAERLTALQTWVGDEVKASAVP